MRTSRMRVSPESKRARRPPAPSSSACLAASRLGKTGESAGLLRVPISMSAQTSKYRECVLLFNVDNYCGS